MRRKESSRSPLALPRGPGVPRARHSRGESAAPIVSSQHRPVTELLGGLSASCNSTRLKGISHQSTLWALPGSTAAGCCGAAFLSQNVLSTIDHGVLPPLHDILWTGRPCLLSRPTMRARRLALAALPIVVLCSMTLTAFFCQEVLTMQSRRKQLQKCPPGKFCHSCISGHEMKTRHVFWCLVVWVWHGLASFRLDLVRQSPLPRAHSEPSSLESTEDATTRNPDSA